MNVIHPLRCPYDEEIEEIMSNFDHQIEEDIAQELKERPCFSRYAGWSFNGKVWYDRSKEIYRCEIWQYHSYMGTLSGTLQEIMNQASDEYGSD